MSDIPPRGSGSPSFEADFTDLRESRGLSLDDLHHETRIPVDVLRRFESGSLLADSSFSDVYLRAFMKSYAKALGVPQSQALAAFDAHAAGRYAGQLREDYTPPTPSAPPATPAPVSPDAPRAEAPDAPAENRPAPTPPSREAAPAVQALRTGGTAVPAERRQEPTVEATRVNRPIVPTAKRSFDKNWGTLGGLAFVLIAAVALAFWFLVLRDDGPDDEVVATDDTQEDTAAPDTTEAPEGPVGPRLQTPIVVTVNAEGDGLQWFRYSTDGEGSFTWVDTGSSETFTADSSVVLLGEGNQGGTAYDFEETTVELQGMRWKPANGSAVRVSLRNGQALLDSLARAGVSAGGPALGTATTPQ